MRKRQRKKLPYHRKGTSWQELKDISPSAGAMEMYRKRRGRNPRAEKTGEGEDLVIRGEGPGTSSCELGSSLPAGLAHAGLEGLDGHMEACTQARSRQSLVS